MTAIDDPFPGPLVGERLGDFVLTIRLVCMRAGQLSTEVTYILSTSVMCICSMTCLAGWAPIDFACFEALQFIMVLESLL